MVTEQMTGASHTVKSHCANDWCQSDGSEPKATVQMTGTSHTVIESCDKITTCGARFPWKKV